MLFTFLMVLYVVLAVFLIGFILIQRGAGAAAGSGFGAGASATVFGARGSASFLTKATKWLAICFFLLTLGMATYVQRSGLVRGGGDADLGVMSGVEVPVAPAPSEALSEVPSAPVGAAPAEAGDAAPEAPASGDEAQPPADGGQE